MNKKPFFEEICSVTITTLGLFWLGFNSVFIGLIFAYLRLNEELCAIRRSELLTVSYFTGHFLDFATLHVM